MSGGGPVTEHRYGWNPPLQSTASVYAGALGPITKQLPQIAVELRKRGARNHRVMLAGLAANQEVQPQDDVSGIGTAQGKDLGP